MHIYTSDQDYLAHLTNELADRNPGHLMGFVLDGISDHSVHIPLAHSVRSAVWYNNSAMSELAYTDAGPGEPVTLKWSGSDNQARFEQNWAEPAARDQLNHWGWTDSNITYELNSDGWRSQDCAEYDVDEPCLIAIGCSFTYGSGLNLHQTWCAKVAAQLGLRLVNLGMPGHALDLSTVWLLLNQHRIKDPRAVILCEPPAGRLTWLTHNSNEENAYGHTMLSMVRQGDDINLVDSQALLTYKWLITNLKLNASLNYYKNSSLVKLWAASRSVPFLHFNNLDPTKPPTSWARDLGHHGEPWHDAVAVSVLQWTESHVRKL